MAEFNAPFQHTIDIEAGYANDSDDRGGETFVGISRVHWPDWHGWQIIDTYPAASRRALRYGDNPKLDRAVQEFYRAEFWDRLNLDAVNKQTIAAEVFDTAINCGLSKASEILQRSLNMVGGFPGRRLSVDGKIGPKTVSAVNGCRYPEALLKCLNGFQFEHYYQIVKRDISQRKWFRGWLRRVWEDHSEQ